MTAAVQKNGKPRSQQRRLSRLAATRLTEDEMAAVCMAARRRRLSVSAYIRTVINASFTNANGGRS